MSKRSFWTSITFAIYVQADKWHAQNIPLKYNWDKIHVHKKAVFVRYKSSRYDRITVI